MIGWRIPRMTDPLGRYWDQPRDLCARVRLFDTHATISERDWQRLPRYDSSIPSGVYPGKAWRRGKFLCWFGPDRNGSCHVGYLRALIQ